MSDVDLHTIMFADRPDRLTEVIDTAAITEHWDEMFADSAPNAVLVEHQPDGATDSLVVVLRRPVLDTVAGTLSYDIEVLADEQHPDAVDGLVGDLHDDPPAKFGAVSLFIDNAPQRLGYRVSEPPPPPEEVPAPPPPDAWIPPPPMARSPGAATGAP